MSRKDEIAQEMSELMPIFLMNMFPYVFQPIDVPPSQVLALICAENKPLSSLSELAKAMHVSSPTITGIVDRLERDKYIERVPSQEDRRVTQVKVTKKGYAIIKQLRDNIQKRWGYILTKVSNDQAESIITMVKNITRGFQDGTI